MENCRRSIPPGREVTLYPGFTVARRVSPGPRTVPGLARGGPNPGGRLLAKESHPFCGRRGEGIEVGGDGCVPCRDVGPRMQGPNLHRRNSARERRWMTALKAGNSATGQPSLPAPNSHQQRPRVRVRRAMGPRWQPQQGRPVSPDARGGPTTNPRSPSWPKTKKRTSPP